MYMIHKSSTQTDRPVGRQTKRQTDTQRGTHPMAKCARTLCSGVTLVTYFFASYLLFLFIHTSTKGWRRERSRKRRSEDQESKERCVNVQIRSEKL